MRVNLRTALNTEISRAESQEEQKNNGKHHKDDPERFKPNISFDLLYQVRVHLRLCQVYFPKHLSRGQGDKSH